MYGVAFYIEKPDPLGYAVHIPIGIKNKMKTNHHRKNPSPFQRETQEQSSRNFKESGGPNYSVMGYLARRRHGAHGMEHDGGHRGNAQDIKEAKTARKRTERRISNHAVKQLSVAE